MSNSRNPVAQGRARSNVAPAPLASVVLVLLTVVVVLWPSFLALHARWVDTDAITNSHGYLIVLVCCWLIYRSRAKVAAVTPSPSRLALVAVLVGGAAWVAFHRAGIQDLELLMVPTLTAGAIAAGLGWSALRVLAFPIAYFVFAMPGWDHLTVALQTLTSKAVAVFAELVGFPASVHDNFVRIPEGTFHIEGGCSGLHFMIVGLAVAALQGELDEASPRMRGLLLGVMAVLALATNWFRVIAIVVAGHVTDMQSYLITRSHYGFGWAVFAVALVGFLFVANWLNRRYPSPPTRVPSRATVTPVSWAWILVAILGLAAVPVTSRAARALASSPSAVELTPPIAQGWTATAVASSDWKPHFVGASASMRRQFVDIRGAAVEMFAVLYLQQRQGAELIGYDNALYGLSDEWNERSLVQIEIDGQKWLQAELVGERQRRSVVRFRYYVDGRPMVRGLEEQLWYGVRSLYSSPTASLIAFRSDCDDGCEQAAARITALARATSSWRAR